MGTKRVMVSGCFDLVHAGHVEFLRRAAEFGDLHVVIGTDANVERLKNVRPTYDQTERKFIVENLAVVKCASIDRRGDGRRFRDTRQDRMTDHEHLRAYPAA